jgi:hypothetical protein
MIVDYGQNHFCGENSASVFKKRGSMFQKQYGKGEFMGLLGSLFNIVAKKVNTYSSDSLSKEKARMATWSNKRLAYAAKNKSYSPEGIAAMQMLKEKGYSASDIAKM